MRKLCQRSNRFVVSKLPCFKIFIIIYIYAVSTILYTAISIKVVPRAERKSRIRARKAAGNRLFVRSIY